MRMYEEQAVISPNVAELLGITAQDLIRIVGYYCL